MRKTPDKIRSYLSRLDGIQRVDGYLCIDESDQLSASEGWIGSINLAELDSSATLMQSLPMLEGLLPANKKTPTVINNVHIDENNYFDIHLFYAGYTVCVLFIDRTITAKQLQKEQQIRLSDDFTNDQQRRG